MRKSCLSNVIAFYDGMEGWVDEGRAVEVAYLDFCKAFGTVFHNILVGETGDVGCEDGEVDRELAELRVS